jgi:hypothetical protein
MYIGREHCGFESTFVKLENAFHKYTVTYNEGLQHLLLHEYVAALSCFGRCASMVSLLGSHSSACNAMHPVAQIMQPLLCIRAAESVLGIHNQRYSSANKLDDKAKSGLPSGAQGLLRQAQNRLEAALEFLASKSDLQHTNLLAWLPEKVGGLHYKHSSHEGKPPERAGHNLASWNFIYTLFVFPLPICILKFCMSFNPFS